jgi:hypothetical protein
VSSNPALIFEVDDAVEPKGFSSHGELLLYEKAKLEDRLL